MDLIIYIACWHPLPTHGSQSLARSGVKTNLSYSPTPRQHITYWIPNGYHHSRAHSEQNFNRSDRPHCYHSGYQNSFSRNEEYVPFNVSTVEGYQSSKSATERRQSNGTFQVIGITEDTLEITGLEE